MLFHSYESGIMFPVECKGILPIEHMLITSVSVRGMLGPVTVWISKNEDEEEDEISKRIDGDDMMLFDENTMGRNGATLTSARSQDVSPAREAAKPAVVSPFSFDHSDWKMIYEREHPPSMAEFVELHFDTPIKLGPNQSCGIYIHSRRPGDEAIVYDNQRTEYTYDDKFLRIRPGK